MTSSVWFPNNYNLRSEFSPETITPFAWRALWLTRVHDLGCTGTLAYAKHWQCI